MRTLSPHIYQKASEAAHLLKAAERKIRILRNVSWAPEIGEEFLAGGCDALPVVTYPDFDGRETRDALGKVKSMVEGEHPILQWLSRTSDTLERATYMLDSMGTSAFYTHSQILYGTPTDTMRDGVTQNLSLAQHMDSAFSRLDAEQLVLGDGDPDFPASEFAQKLEQKLSPYFGNATPDVVLTPNLSSKALAGARRIQIHSDAWFTDMDVHQLLNHEALVHVATSLNGKAQADFPILGAAHAGTTEIQEGLAVFAEIITGAMDPVRFRRLVDRVIAIQMAVDGADFVEVFRYFSQKCNQSGDALAQQQVIQRQAFDDTRRVFRGGVISGGAPFTKDGVYLNGLLRVHNFMRTVTQLGRADLLRVLFVGKLDLEDVPAIAMLAADGKLTPAKFLPPWISDMRFLVSYLAYSSFLNQVKLPGFQKYYAELLADVPDIWGFVK